MVQVVAPWSDHGATTWTMVRQSYSTLCWRPHKHTACERSVMHYVAPLTAQVYVDQSSWCFRLNLCHSKCKCWKRYSLPIFLICLGWYTSPGPLNSNFVTSDGVLRGHRFDGVLRVHPFPITSLHSHDYSDIKQKSFLGILLITLEPLQSYGLLWIEKRDFISKSLFVFSFAV